MSCWHLLFHLALSQVTIAHYPPQEIAPAEDQELCRVETICRYMSIYVDVLIWFRLIYRHFPGAHPASLGSYSLFPDHHQFLALWSRAMRWNLICAVSTRWPGWWGFWGEGHRIGLIDKLTCLSGRPTDLGGQRNRRWSRWSRRTRGNSQFLMPSLVQLQLHPINMAACQGRSTEWQKVVRPPGESFIINVGETLCSISKWTVLV